MYQLWIIVIALLALLLVTRIRSRRGAKKRRTPPPVGPRIQGRQVVTEVHPRMSTACLFDHGLQFGKGFRRKEGPKLPHDAECRCDAVPFAFTSSEVFNGALRQRGAARCSLAGLAAEDVQRLIEQLKAAEAPQPVASLEAYAAAVGIDDFPAAARDGLRAFLAERHSYLLRTPREAAPGSALDAPEPLANPEPR